MHRVYVQIASCAITCIFCYRRENILEVLKTPSSTHMTMHFRCRSEYMYFVICI